MLDFASYLVPDDETVNREALKEPPIVKTIECVFKTLPCPWCRADVPRKHLDSRCVYDYGDEAQQRPIQIKIIFSRHYCFQCKKSFKPNTDDMAPPRSHYTHRVIQHAIRLVVEDNMAYRTATWNLWRDHKVFVPHATIQNWVEAAGKKSGIHRHSIRVPRRCPA